MSKKRIKFSLYGSEIVKPIAWYTGTQSWNIINTIKEVSVNLFKTNLCLFVFRTLASARMSKSAFTTMKVALWCFQIVYQTTHTYL